ncbi:MAG: ATP-binding protein [Pseudomonadota bacterium]|nr:ATP-binding protein [Pseudomonadota bacterium]
MPALTRLVPVMPSMTPNTALSLVACGLALALPHGARHLAQAFAGFAIVIGGLTMVEYGTGRDLGIDHAFIQGTLRMAPQTSISLTLLGLALLARRTPGRESVTQPLAVLPVLLCYLSIVGLLFNATVPVFPLATTMALNTAVAIVLVSLGLVLSQPGSGLLYRWRSTGPGGRTLRFLLPAFVLLPPFLALLRSWGESAGAYDEGFGIALQATAMLALLATGVLVHSRSLDAAESERAGQAERFRHIVENIPEGVCVIDACGQVLYANARLDALLGRRTRSGLSLSDCVEPQVRTLFHDFLRHAEHGPARATLAVRCEGAELRSLRFSATPLPDPLAPDRGGTLLFAIDETSRRLAEGRLRERARALEQSLRDVDAFARLAAHDLREPLRKIQLLADRASLDATTTADALLRIRRSAALLQAGLGDLLAYSRLAASAHMVRGVDIGAVVREAEERLGERFRSAGASIVVGVLPTINGDPALLCELFVHLFDNALKFRRADVPPVIRVASNPRTGGKVELTVEDNGVGLDPADAEQLFEVFRTLHPRDRYPGSGIGLATCRRIAELHGGEITARGVLGEGAVFSVLLPVHASLGVPPECVPSDAE